MQSPDRPASSVQPISPSSHGDAIIRVAAYHRRAFGHAVIHPSTPLDSPGLSLFKSFNRYSVSTLGLLELLPVEILTSIFLLLDLQSALSFSHTSIRAKQLISGIWEYRQVRRYALRCLWAAFRTGVASNHGVAAIYTALTTNDCSLCGAFGGFFFLPTATLCCFPCLENAPDLEVLTLAKVCKVTGKSRSRVTKAIPVSHTIPGTYGMLETNRRRKGYLVAKSHCSEHLQDDRLERLAGPPIVRYMVATSIPYFDVKTCGIQTGLSCKGCQAMLGDSDVEAAFADDLFRLRDKVYSREGFLSHFWQCDGAKALWASSKGGTVSFE